MKFYENAYAKINLFLDVNCKMDNGFHGISSVMHTVSLKDDIAVELVRPRQELITMYIKGDIYLHCGSKNLAYRASEAFMEAYGEKFPVHITMHKRIPIAAGLAGGSSDAAAVLRALNRAKNKPFTVSELCAIGEKLGSDIPFCIRGRTHLCEGRGEILTPVKNNLNLDLVIAIANEHVSTPAAYGTLDKMYNDFRVIDSAKNEKMKRVISSLEKGDKNALCQGLYNIFEGAVLPECPGAVQLKQQMLSLGALAAMMSGSGPSVFGIFPDREAAQAAAQKIGTNAYAVHSIV